MKFTSAFITEALGKHLKRTVGTAGPATGVNTDTRTIASGELYVPLVGERFDGHDYITAALEAGAVAAFCQERAAGGVEGAGALYVVDDTLAALQALARAHLQRIDARRIALTGSNGKTTTKELLFAALSGVLGDAAVMATHGNLNNHIGVPLTALRAEPEHEALVIEMGMNHFGEIALLTDIAQPHVGLVTNVQGAHAGNLGGIEGVAKAKGELYLGIAESGVAVVNLDDARCVERAKVVSRQTTFGSSADADVAVSDIVQDAAGLRFQLTVAGRSIAASIPLVGRHNAQNAAAAIAVVEALGLDVDAAVAGLANTRAPAGRLAVKHVSATDWLVLDDTYNANPASFVAGLDALTALADGRPLAVAVGDMLELGDDAEAAHRDIGATLVRRGVSFVATCGALGRQVRDGAIDAGLSPTHILWAEDSTALAPMLRGALAPKSAVFVKGSRGARMERVVDALIGET